VTIRLEPPDEIAFPGLDPEAHIFSRKRQNKKTWMAGSGPAKGKKMMDAG
jgi:hypothetical protein